MNVIRLDCFGAPGATRVHRTRHSFVSALLYLRLIAGPVFQRYIRSCRGYTDISLHFLMQC